MARPKSKSELLQLAEKNYQRLLTQINNLSPHPMAKEFPKGMLNRNVRDVLAHLHHWHCMMFDWYEVGMQGEKPTMPAEGYTWKTVPALNQWIWEHYNSVDFARILEKFSASHGQLLQLIAAHSNEELFEKKHYPWTGSTSLGAYLISASSSHYDWAYKLIRRATK